MCFDGFCNDRNRSIFAGFCRRAKRPQSRLVQPAWQIDVAQVISNEIQKIAISGHSHGNKAPMTLGFQALITRQCRKAGVDIPNVATKRISSIMNDDYMLRHCVPKLAGEAAPQS
ncbi:hypothetical protein RYX36_009981 [Vicia faba]